MTETTIRRHIKKAWDENSHAFFNDGKQWYPKMREYLDELAKENEIELSQSCGIFSSLSPMKSVSLNKRLAEGFLNGKRSGHYKKQIKKAEAILNVSSPIQINRILNGPKTVSFFRHLYTPWDDRYCVCDTHIVKLCNGGEVTKVTPKRYRLMSEEIRRLSRRLELKVSETQAVLWLTSKHLYGNDV